MNELRPLFIATERFDSANGDAWLKYCNWAKIPKLVEIVGLDALLCKHLIKEFLDEDWNHIVNADFRLDYFYDLDYLVQRVREFSRRNILGLYRNPQRHIFNPPEPGEFIFVGYDLIEEQTQISAINNCGGFPDAFSNDELNRFGLIDLFDRAVEIKRLLAELHPEEHHAQCELYAVWRLNEDPLSSTDVF